MLMLSNHQRMVKIGHFYKLGVVEYNILQDEDGNVVSFNGVEQIYGDVITSIYGNNNKLELTIEYYLGALLTKVANKYVIDILSQQGKSTWCEIH